MKRTQRESDPGQIKAGVSLKLLFDLPNVGIVLASCTSNVSVNYAGRTFLVTAGHCVYPGENAAYNGQTDVPNWHNDGVTGVKHSGLYIGNSRYFSAYDAGGKDIALIEYKQPGAPPFTSAGGLASGLYTLTPDLYRNCSRPAGEVYAGAGWGGVQGPVVKSWRSTSRRLMPCLPAVWR